MSASQTDKANRFKTLHNGPRAFLIANAWDAGSARILAGLGFPALATSSGASAGVLGKRDGQVTRVVIVVPPTATNRRALAALDGPSLGLRLGTRSVMAALAAARDPGQDAIVVI